MTTVFGPVKFVSYDGMTNQNRLTAYVGQWQDGVFKGVASRNREGAVQVKVKDGWN